MGVCVGVAFPHGGIFGRRYVADAHGGNGFVDPMHFVELRAKMVGANAVDFLVANIRKVVAAIIHILDVANVVDFGHAGGDGRPH